jgi:hypothetical protein
MHQLQLPAFRLEGECFVWFLAQPQHHCSVYGRFQEEFAGFKQEPHNNPHYTHFDSEWKG